MGWRKWLLALAWCAPVAAQQVGPGGAVVQNPEWRQPFPAFKLIGNVYWVGTYDLSTYLITTDAGHILINTGFAETVPQIKSGVEQLGFELDDVEILLATHAHGDHVAGLAEQPGAIVDELSALSRASGENQLNAGHTRHTDN